MRHLANFIKIVPFHHYISFDGSTITASSEVDIFESDTDITFDEVPKDKNGNPYYEQTLKLVSEKLDSVTRVKYPQNIPVVVLIYTDDMGPYILGNDETKLRITIQPTPNEDIITLTRASIETLF